MAIDYDRQPFPEAVEFLSGKINIDTNGWSDVWRDQHDAQFMAAGFKGTALQIIRDAIDKAIQQGSTLQEFMREGFDRAVAEGGVDYRGDRNWRAAIIYNTNLRTAYAAGRYQQMSSPETLRRRPYWEWRHGDSNKPRPLHLALDGKVFPAGSPFWDSLFPPAGFNCKCRVFALSERDLRRMGKDAPDEPPEVGGELEATDPLTGQATRLTVQADPGWDYVPGKSTVQQRRAAVLSKLAPQLQAQLLAEVGEDAGLGEFAAPKQKSCKTGKSCGNTCISKNKECRTKLPEKAAAAAKKLAGVAPKKRLSEKNLASDGASAPAPTAPEIPPTLRDFADFMAAAKTGAKPELTSEQEKTALTKLSRWRKDESKIKRLQGAGLSEIEAASFAAYIGDNYVEMNRALWDPGSAKPGIMEVNKSFALGLLKIEPITPVLIQSSAKDRLESSGWGEDKPLKRHEKIPSKLLDNYIEKYKRAKGGYYTDERFLSTTIAQDGIDTFAAESNVEFNIRPRLDGRGAGRYVDTFKNKVFEGEVLYPPMSRFKVTGVTEIPARVVEEELVVKTKKAIAHNEITKAFQVALKSDADAPTVLRAQLAKLSASAALAPEDRERIKKLLSQPFTQKALGEIRAEYKAFAGQEEKVTKKRKIPARYIVDMEEE